MMQGLRAYGYMRGDVIVLPGIRVFDKAVARQGDA